MTEKFEADVTGYVAGLDAMVAAAERARDMNYELIASLEMVQRAQQGEAAAAAASAAAQSEAAGATKDTAAAAAEAAAATEKLTGNLGEEAAAATTAADAVSRLQYDIARAAAAAETALVMVRPAVDSWRDSIEEAMAAAELAEFQIDAMDRAIDKSGGDAVLAAQALRTLAAAEAEVAAATTMDADALRLEAEMAADAAKEQALLTAARLASIDATLAAARAETILTAVGNEDAIAAKKAADAAAAAASGFRLWGLSATALHWIISGSAELLAVVIPAAIAAAAGAFVLYQGLVEQVGFRMQALYTTTEATGAMMHQTTGDVLGLGHAFQSAQDAANPIAYQLLGEYLIAARSHMVNLAQAGLQVDRALGGLGAKIDVDLIQQGSSLDSLLSHMVPDLIQLGEVFGNIGHAVLSFASQMPGLAELLLHILAGVTGLASGLIDLASKFQVGGVSIITMIIGLEEFNRWGSLAVTVMGKMGLATTELSGATGSYFLVGDRFIGVLKNMIGLLPQVGFFIAGLASKIPVLGAAIVGETADVDAAKAATMGWIEGLSALQTVGIAAAIAGLAALIIFVDRSKTATEQWIASSQAAVSAASNVNVLGVIYQAQGETLNKLTVAQHQYTTALSEAGGQAVLGGQRFAYLNSNVGIAGQRVLELTNYQKQLVQQQNSVIAGAGTAAKLFGGSLAQGLGLADAAGVKLANTQVILGKNANQAGIQLEALVQGYQHMDQVGPILGQDMNAVAAAAGLQNTKVSSLNQAWDQFLSNATGLTSNFASLTTDIGEINNAVTTTGSKFDVFGGKVVSSTQAAALSLRSFSGVGAQVWQNYDAGLQQAQQYTDQLRIAATTGAVSQKAFTQQIAYTAQQLLPYAQYSKAATSELSVLVQEAGGPATSNFKTLKNWIDKNTESTAQFMKQTIAETGAMSDATQVAESYASTLNSAVASALQAGTIASAGLTQKTEALDNAWQHASHTITGPVVSAFAAQVAGLTLVYGSTKTAIAVADGLMRQQGATAGQVAQLNAEIRGQVAALNLLNGRNFTYTITQQERVIGSIPGGVPSGTGSGNPVGGGLQTGAQYASAGVHLVGEQGPELVRFGGGESVLPSWQTAPILHGGGGSGDGTVNLASHTTLNVSGAKVGSVMRTQTLVYNRRNTGNNWALRNR